MEAGVFKTGPEAGTAGDEETEVANEFCAEECVSHGGSGCFTPELHGIFPRVTNFLPHGGGEAYFTLSDRCIRAKNNPRYVRGLISSLKFRHSARKITHFTFTVIFSFVSLLMPSMPLSFFSNSAGSFMSRFCIFFIISGSSMSLAISICMRVMVLPSW